ncbi:MAG: hypothetical protein ACOYKD_07530 [Anaerolineaceae bacterium]|jgi:hypothetical protein
MSEIKPETGFLGFFDILGYSQIILNNNIRKTAKFVSDTLINLPQDITRDLSPNQKPNSQEPAEKECWRSMLEKVKWIIFSDSILISMPFDAGLNHQEQLKHYEVFVTVCTSLLNRSFLAGFPLRGSISVGEFFIEDRCFAGKPIISAYRVAQELEFSGGVLDEEANAFISQLRKELVRSGDSRQLSMLDETTILYYVPLKEGRIERRRTINWVSFRTPGIQPIAENIRDVTMQAFLMHNKIAIPEVHGKIINTEMFIRHVLTNIELHPWE